MYYVYILRSLTRNYIYVGLTNDLARRVKQHQEGKSSTTRSYKPFELMFTQQFETRIEARNKEKYLKSGAGKEWIKAQLK